MDQSPNTVTCNNSRSQRTNSAGVFIFRPSQQKCKNTWKRNHRTKKKEATGRVPAKCNNRTCLCLCRWVGRSRKKKARIVTLTLKKVHKFCQAVMRTFKEAAEKGVSKNACGMRGPHRQSLTMRLAEKCNGTYEMRKLSRKGQRKKCNAVLLEACAHCEDNTTSIKETHTQYLEWINHTKHKNGTHYHANGASALRHRFIGGGPAPVWTSISSTSPSSFAASATPSTPVCFLCSRCAPDYVPCAFQEIYSAKCSSCKRANCNQCGKWEGSSFFCKWCFDEGITPSVEAMQSWKAAQQTHTRKPSIELEHAKRLRQYALDMRGAMPVRFQGGGTEELQCFMCLAYKSAYVSKQLSDEYVSHCYTCGRGACDSHGSWEAGHFHCALCHATDDGLLAEVKDTFAVRCLSKTFQNQRLLHTNEEAFNDFLLTLCTGGINRPRGMGNYDEQGLKVPPQEAAGVELPWDDARQLVEAIVLSRVNTPDDAEKVLGQSWVPTWDGWKELRQCATERCCVAIVERLCDIAQQNASYQSKTDTQALQALASEGFMWRKAVSHGVNNCLIDSLMLCLSYEHILPNNLTTDVTARRRVATACRKHLIQEIGDEVAPGSNGLFPFLDAHRDGPRIVDFLLHWFRVVARSNMLIHVHDRFGEHAAGADWNKIAVNLGHGYPQQTVLQLHIYNHTSVQRRGYHFDSLLPITGRDAEPKKKRSRTIASTNAMEIEAEPVATESQLNDLHREPQQSSGIPEKPSCSKEGAEQEADHRAEAVFANMAWYFHGTTFATSWLDALLANLIFHGYMLKFPDLLARQDARFHLCRTCQASLELEQLEGDEAFHLQRHLARAVLFFTSGSRGEVNAEVHVYDSTTTDLSVPRDVYTIGRRDSLLVPVFRLYRYRNGRYAALLPANPAERPVFTSGDSYKASQGSKQNAMNATCAAAPPANTFGTIDCAGAATDLSAPQIAEVRDILQRFCDQRGADVQVDETDAQRVSDAWWNLDALGIILHTLLQAGLTFADAGMHHARRLANQWRGSILHRRKVLGNDCQMVQWRKLRRKM